MNPQHFGQIGVNFSLVGSHKANVFNGNAQRSWTLSVIFAKTSASLLSKTTLLFKGDFMPASESNVSHLEVLPSVERGFADHGWLKSRHTFSFAGYRNPEWMQFSALRVINEDWVEPGRGFGTHPHENMEIITFIIEGALEHKDSMGNGSVIRPGEIQRMSAGTGISHSEFNPSEKEKVHLLQIWILPSELNIEPGYEQKSFDLNKEGWFCLASPNPKDSAVKIHQDADIHLAQMSEGTSLSRPFRKERKLWIQVAKGQVELEGKTLSAGDGGYSNQGFYLNLAGLADSQVLIFDLP